MKRSKFVVLILLCLPLRAQTEHPAAIAQEIIDKALANTHYSTFAGTVQPDPITGTSAIDGLIATWMLDRQGSQEELLHWMEHRSELQMGANPELGGGGPAILKALPPSVLGIATDMGLVTRSANGPLVTFRATPSGIARVLLGSTAMRQPWDRLSASATFEQTSNTSGGERLAAWSVALEIYNGRKARASQWRAMLHTGDSYLHAREALVAALGQWPEFHQWQMQFADRLELEVDRPLSRHWIDATAASSAALRIATEELTALGAVPVPVPLTAALRQYGDQLRAQLQQRDRVRQLPRTGSILAADWTVVRPLGHRAQWAATAIASTTLGRRGRADLTANATVQSAGGIRAALDLTFPMQSGLGSLTARYSRAQWNSGKADIQLQATWSIRLATGIRFPITVSMDRGHFTGITTGQVSAGLQLATDVLLNQLRQK